jgi:membrane-associated protease RseP (regulator of RpoE activity)
MASEASILVLATLYGIISVLAGIILHELGHLLAARHLGITVSAVSIGFGPELVGFTDRHGVRWKLAPLLVGGACSFLPAERVNGPETRLLHQASAKDRAIVLIAGPASNLCFAGLVWLVIFFHKAILPFMLDDEAVFFGLPAFLFMTSCAIGFFNLLPVPPLDGGYLVLLALEKFSGQPLSNQKQLIKAGSWVIGALTASVTLLFLMRVVNGAS